MQGSTLLVLGMIVVVLLVIIPAIVTIFLRSVDAGTARMVSWWGGTTRIYLGPGKSYEIPLLTTGTTLPVGPSTSISISPIKPRTLTTMASHVRSKCGFWQARLCP